MAQRLSDVAVELHGTRGEYMELHAMLWARGRRAWLGCFLGTSELHVEWDVLACGQMVSV